MSAQVRLDAVIVAAGWFLTSPDIGYSVTRYRAPRVVVLGVAGSNRFEVGGAVPQTAVIPGMACGYLPHPRLHHIFARRL